MTQSGAIEGQPSAEGQAETVRRIEVALPIEARLPLEEPLSPLDDTTIHTRQTRPEIVVDGVGPSSELPATSRYADPGGDTKPSLYEQGEARAALESSADLDDDPDAVLLLTEDLRSEPADVHELPEGALEEEDGDLLESGEFESLRVDGDEVSSASGSIHIVMPDFTDATIERGSSPSHVALPLTVLRSKLGAADDTELARPVVQELSQSEIEATCTTLDDAVARASRNPELAAQILEEARQISPADARVLGALSTLYRERGDDEKLVSVLESIAAIEEDVPSKIDILFALAALFREELVDVRREVDALDRILDHDKTRLEAFEQISQSLTNAHAWVELEEAYRRMLARVVHDDDEAQRQLKFVLFRQLGLVYRDRLADADRAYEAFAAAAHLKPEDAEVRRTLTEILVVTDHLDDAVARVRELIGRAPTDPELYQELYELFLRQHEFDLAWCAVNVLGDLRELTTEQRRFLDDYPPVALNDVPSQLVEQAWRSHLLAPDLDPILGRLLARMTPVVARMRHAQRLGAPIERLFTAMDAHRHDAVRQMFIDAAEILGMTPPELFLGDPSVAAPFTPTLSPFGAMEVSVPALDAQADCLPFIIGRRLAELRPELLAHAFFPSVPELSALLGSAVRVSRDETAGDALGRALDLALATTMTREELADIQDHVDEITRKGGLVDVKRWSRAAELSALRTGLLITGDVTQARKALASDRAPTLEMSIEEKLGELYQYAVSDRYAELRVAIGVAVRQDE